MSNARPRDEGAAREVMRHTHPLIVRITRRHLPFRMDEEDLAQEVLVKLSMRAG